MWQLTFLLAALLVAGCSSVTAPTPPRGASQESALPIGEWLALGDTEIRLCKVSAIDFYGVVGPGGQWLKLNAQPGQRYYGLIMEARNTGPATAERRFEWTDFRILNKNRQVIEPATTVVGRRVPGTGDQFRGTIVGGGSLRGDVSFEADSISAAWFEPSWLASEKRRVWLTVPESVDVITVPTTTK
ncbi:MAG: hypothetical protein ACYC4L_09770 [Chloroflexota bacterium]